MLILLFLKYVLEGRSLYLPHEIKRDRKRVAEFEEKIRIFNNETPMDPRFKNFSNEELDCPIYRIFPLKYFLDMIENSRLLLPKINSWEDPYENFILRSNIFANGELIENLQEESDLVFGQCWSIATENDAMWRIYSPNKECIRVKTSVRKLLNLLCPVIQKEGHFGLFLNETIIGKVLYKDQTDINVWVDSIEINPHNSDIMPIIIESLLIKRKAFEHEKEVRVIFNAEDSDERFLDGTPNLVVFEMDRPMDFIEEVKFDPRCDNSFFSLYKKIFVEKYHFEAASIIKSNMYEFEPFDINLNV